MRRLFPGTMFRSLPYYNSDGSYIIGQGSDWNVVLTRKHNTGLTTGMMLESDGSIVEYEFYEPDMTEVYYEIYKDEF